MKARSEIAREIAELEKQKWEIMERSEETQRKGNAWTSFHLFLFRCYISDGFSNYLHFLMPRVDRKTHGVSQEKYPSNLRESRKRNGYGKWTPYGKQGIFFANFFLAVQPKRGSPNQTVSTTRGEKNCNNRWTTAKIVRRRINQSSPLSMDCALCYEWTERLKC